MRKTSILFGFAIMMIAGAAFATTPAEDEASYDPVPFIIDDEVNMTSDYSEVEAAYAADDEAAMTPLTTPVCGGGNWCVFNGTEILCTVPEGSALDTAVGFKYEVANRIHICTYTGGAWVEMGWCDTDTRNQLRVLGMNSSRDSIGIVRHVYGEGAGGAISPGADCNFNEFKDIFEPIGGGYLKIYGRGLYDWVYGSHYDDYYLSGEYVDGREGDDKLYMTDNEIPGFATYTSAFGDYGADKIYGSASPDNVWADNPDFATKANGGTDYISAAGGDDTLRGAWFDDDIHGGTGSDYIYGGDELGITAPDKQDVLYGDGGRDTMYGMDGTDYIYGGIDNDWLYGNDNMTTDNDGMYDRCWGEAGYGDLCICDWEDATCES